MNEKYLKTEKEIIRETFNDNRKIKCVTPPEIRQVDENIHQGGDVFTTDDGEFIDLEMQLKDFDEDELINKIEFAEALYEKHHKKVSIYLLCPKSVEVRMRECEIKSHADFNIKLARVQESGCQLILKNIKNKIKNNIRLDDDDLYALSMLPMICEKEEIKYYRKEYFKIINNLDY